MAKLKKKEKLFQKAYWTKEGSIYITDNKKSKKKFLKSGIRNVIFGEEFMEDELFLKILCEAKAYDAAFIKKFTEQMVKAVIDKLKLTIPLGEIFVYSPYGEDFTEKLGEYTRLITLMGNEGDGGFEKGVPVRRVKKQPKGADMIICEGEVSAFFDAPLIDFRENPQRSGKTLAWDRMSFKTDLFNFDINTPSLLYFIKKGEIKEFELTDAAKKCRRIFTFS